MLLKTALNTNLAFDFYFFLVLGLGFFGALVFHPLNVIIALFPEML